MLARRMLPLVRAFICGYMTASSCCTFQTVSDGGHTGVPGQNLRLPRCAQPERDTRARYHAGLSYTSDMYILAITRHLHSFQNPYRQLARQRIHRLQRIHRFQKIHRRRQRQGQIAVGCG